MDAASSKLIVHKPAEVRFPALVAGFWFGLSGGAAAMLWLFGSTLVGHSFIGASVLQFVPLALMATGSAFLSGMLLGGKILQRKVSPGYGMLWGMLVVGVSHLCLGFMLAGFTSAAAPVSFVPAVFAIAAMSALAAGIVTFPIGGMAGWYLAKFRDAETGPSGCRLHGYREEETKLLGGDT
jgi:hypothetical protein